MRKLPITIFLLFIFLSIPVCRAIPSQNFVESNGYWYDDWNINRNYYSGSNGYLPKIAYETINENKELAYSIGQSFQEQYQSKIHRAEAILQYVQQWTEYGYDKENVFRNGIPQDEWAWNADETAHEINENMGTAAVGDCEDLAFLCATIYLGAGFDVAIVDAPEHCALLIWLPDYANANNYWDITDDNRSSGWIWVESTSESNPLGWTPPDYEDGYWTAYPIGDLMPIDEVTITPQSSTDIDLIVPIIVIIIIVVISLLFSSTKSKQKRPYLPPPPPY